MNQPRELAHVRAFLNATPMAISEDGYRQLIAIVTAHALGQGIPIEPAVESPLRASLRAAYGDRMDEDESIPYAIVGRMAILEMFGTIVPRAPAFKKVSSVADYRTYQDAFKTALRDDSVDAILTVFDSPGGVVDGMLETCDVIYTARGYKKTIGLADTRATSAAYGMLSQNEEVFCTQYGTVGSIGVLGQIQDTTRAEKNEGVDSVIIRSSELKAPGIGPISANQMQDMMGQMRSRFAQFKSVVQRARAGFDFEAQDPGSVWFGMGDDKRPSAQDVGLVDGVATLDELIETFSV